MFTLLAKFLKPLRRAPKTVSSDWSVHGPKLREALNHRRELFCAYERDAAMVHCQSVLAAWVATHGKTPVPVNWLNDVLFDRLAFRELGLQLDSLPPVVIPGGDKLSKYFRNAGSTLSTRSYMQPVLQVAFTAIVSSRT